MKSRNWRWPVQSVLYAAILIGVSGCAAKSGAAPQMAAAAPTAAAPTAAEPADARGILVRMANFLAKAPRFTVNIHDSYDVVQESGEKIEFSERRSITVSRPNGLRAEVEQSDGEKHLVLYDGQQITVFSPSQNRYAQTSKPGGIDQAVTHFLKDLRMRLPLAALLLSRLPDELERRTQGLAYVERTMLHGVPVHHLAGRTETVDYQVWIAAGAQPLPQRVVLTYKNAEGQPAFRAQFSDWNLAPNVQDSTFAFTPPPGAQKIAFLAELPQFPAPGEPATKQTGGKQ